MVQQYALRIIFANHSNQIIHFIAGELNTYADEGSTLSLLDEDKAIKLGLDRPKSLLTMDEQWIQMKIQNVSVYLDKICGINPGAKTFKLNSVRTIKGLSLP